jgi:hypothetical protein
VTAAVAAAAFGLLATAAAAGEPLRASVEPGLQWLQLAETDADGRRLVQEQGLLAGLRAELRGRLGADGPGWRADLALAAGPLDYDGRTQVGSTLATRTPTTLATAALGLAWPLAGGWSGEGGVEVEAFRRRIEGVGAVAGLDERLVQPRLRLGLAWDGGPWTARASLLAAERAPLAVRFDAGAFDRVTLRSGRATGLAVEAARELAPGWRLAAGLEHIDVGRGLARRLRSDGQPVGEVRQPAWQRQRLWLAAEWTPG